jgi:hypothetical protein
MLCRRCDEHQLQRQRQRRPQNAAEMMQRPTSFLAVIVVDRSTIKTLATLRDLK